MKTTIHIVNKENMSTPKTVAKFVTQMVASIYVSKLTNKLVGQAFDRFFGTKKSA